MRNNSINPQQMRRQSHANSSNIRHNPGLRENQNIAQQSAIQLNRPRQLQSVEQNYKKPSQNPNNIVKQTLYTCRICLEQGPALHALNQQQLQNMNQQLQQQLKTNQPKHLITACKCQGTSGYVHQKCMIQWVDTLCKRTKQKQVKCQICLTQILYQRRTIQYIDCSSKNFKDISSCNIVCFGTSSVIIAGCVALLIKCDALNLNQMALIVVYILLGILGISFFISVMMIIKEGFYKKKKQTNKIYSNDQIDILGVNENQLLHYQIRSSTNARSHTNIQSARIIRSARNVGARLDQIQRRNQERHASQSRSRRSRRSRSRRSNRSRQNIQNQDSNERIGPPPRSTNNARSVQEVQSTRSIQVRSRNNIEQRDN